jgi:hypothetical protein
MILSMLARRGPSRLLALALMTIGAGLASAAKLDKSACNDLNGEHASVLATGVREDMARGPEWAKANLTPDKLANIKRLLELEEQLQFQCGAGRGRALAKSGVDTPEAPSVGRTPSETPDQKITPAEPERKPSSASDGMKAVVMPGAPPKAPAAEKTAPPNPAAQAAARKKPSRRDSSSAYVSPTDVNPYFVGISSSP